jgi:hypothetical protein
MECGKLNGKFLKVKAKVSGFLIAKVEKRNTPEIEKHASITIKSKKNTITGLQYLINAFLTYMRGVTYTGATASLSGIAITTSTGQIITLSFLPPVISATSNSATISFIAVDGSNNSYTATSEELITESAKNYIPIATTNLSVTKQSDEVLTLTWIITITISTGTGIGYIPTPTPQSGGFGCAYYGYSGCGNCSQSTANSLYPFNGYTCSPTGLSSQYTNSSFVTTQLFTDMFYNTYSPGSSNSFVTFSNGILYIYTLYCTEWFVAGASTFISYYNGVVCYLGAPTANPIYLQVFVSTQTEPYIGVQIELTT